MSSALRFRSPAKPVPDHSVDERLRNWQYAVPAADRRLLLPVADEDWVGAERPQTRSRDALLAILSGTPFDGIAVPDIGGWSSALGLSPADLLYRLACAVAPGGWVYCGLVPRWTPRARSGGAVWTLGGARRVFAQAGLRSRGVWIVLPSLNCPAFLIPSTDRAEFDYFLRALYFPYVTGRSALAGWSNHVLQAVGRRLLYALPNRLRHAVAPAIAVVGIRP